MQMLIQNFIFPGGGSEKNFGPDKVQQHFENLGPILIVDQDHAVLGSLL